MMTTMLVWLLTIGPAAAPPVTSAPAEASIETLIADLSRPQYDARLAAARAIVRIGPPAYGPLKEAFRSTSSYDVRRQIRRIAERIYVEEALGPPPAFLGIQHAPISPAEDPNIPMGTIRIRIQNVIRNTSADAAGLRPGDVILGANGKTFPPSDDPRENSFRTWIASNKAGSECTLEIERDGRRRSIVVRLGEMPWNMGYNYAGASDRLESRLATFPAWWQENFDPTGEVDVTGPSDQDRRWRLRTGRGAR